MKNGFNYIMDAVELPEVCIIEQVIVKCQMEEYQKIPRCSKLEFFCTQVLFLKSNIWIMQIACIGIALLLSYVCNQHNMLFLIRWILSFVPVLLHMLSIPLLLRSSDNRVVEIEHVTYYQYSNVFMSRLVLLGVIQLFFISLFMLCTLGITQLSFQQILLYTLVPFHLSYIVSFLVIFIAHQDVCINYSIVSNIILSVILFLLTNTKVYMEDVYLYVWKWMFVISVILIFVMMYCLFWKMKQREEILYDEKRGLLWN